MLFVMQGQQPEEVLAAEPVALDAPIGARQLV